jgi:hypothetical protein
MMEKYKSVHSLEYNMFLNKFVLLTTLPLISCCITLKVKLFCELHASPSFAKMDVSALKYEGAEPSIMFGLLERTDFNHWIGHLFLPPVGRPVLS